MAKKILYVYGGFYSPNGMSMMISQKVNYLAENTDNQIYIVLTEHPEKDSIYKLSDKVHAKWLVVNFDDLDTLPLYKKIPCYFIKQWKYKRLLSRYMMELRPDITVSIARREINFINKIKDGSKKIAEIHFARTFYRKFDKKIFDIKYARENDVPFLGICLGMQMAVVEFARNVLKLKDANSEEFDKKSKIARQICCSY